MANKYSVSRTGFGKFYFNNRNKYVGMWQNNFMNGKGVLKCVNGKMGNGNLGMEHFIIVMVIVWKGCSSVIKFTVKLLFILKMEGL